MSVKTRRVRYVMVDTPITVYRYERACGVCAEVEVQSATDRIGRHERLVCKRCVALGSEEHYGSWRKVYCAKTPEEAYSRRVALELMK